MKIAYVCADPGIPVFGNKGCSIHVQEILRSFCKSGHDVTLYAARIGGSAPKDLDNVVVKPLVIQKAETSLDRERACVEANNQLFSRLGSDGPFELLYERYSLWSGAGIHYARFHKNPECIRSECAAY